MSSKADASGTAATAAAPRAPNRVVATWRGGLIFDAGRPGGPTVRVDGNGETAPGPVDTLLNAVATCSASDVVLILEKQRTPPTSLEVEVVGTRVDGTPRRLKHVLLVWHIAGERIERAAAERAIDLATTKYCSVRDSLDPAVPVEWKLELNGTSGRTRRTPTP